MVLVTVCIGVQFNMGSSTVEDVIFRLGGIMGGAGGGRGGASVGKGQSLYEIYTHVRSSEASIRMPQSYIRGKGVI